MQCANTVRVSTEKEEPVQTPSDPIATSESVAVTEGVALADDIPPEVVAAEAAQSAQRRRMVLQGFAKFGFMVGRGAVAVGSAVASGYRAIDPDLRRNLAAAPLFGLTMLSAREEPIEALADDGHRPVLFVHGLGGHRGNFSPMRTAFRLLGRTRTYSAALPEDLSIEDLGVWLRTVIAKILEVNALGEESKIDVVAHSMGGIVSRVALQDPACAARVRTLLTLGTPHSGTHLARLADTHRTRAMRPQSELMAQLSAQIPWKNTAEMPRLVCVGSPADVVIIPAETAYVDGAEHIELPGFTHSGFLLHPKAFGTVYQALLR